VQKFEQSKTKIVVGSYQAAVEVLRGCDPADNVLWVHRGHSYFLPHELVFDVLCGSKPLSPLKTFIRRCVDWLNVRAYFALAHWIMVKGGMYVTLGPPMTKEPWWHGGVLTKHDMQHLRQFKQVIVKDMQVDTSLGTLVFNHEGGKIVAGKADAVVLCTGQRTERQDVYGWEGRLQKGMFDPPFMTMVNGRCVLITYMVASYLEGRQTAYSDGRMQRELAHVSRQREKYTPEECTPGLCVAWMSANRGFEKLLFPRLSEQGLEIATHPKWLSDWFGKGVDPRDVFRECAGDRDPSSATGSVATDPGDNVPFQKLASVIGMVGAVATGVACTYTVFRGAVRR